jgi:hypothetical protein
LPAGAEVYVLKEEPVDWYQIAHAGRVGFVHKAYVRLDQRHGPRVEPEMKRQPTRIRVGMILMAGGVIFVAWVLAPDLLLQAAVLGSAFGLVVVLDQLFQLGLLYSLFSAAFVALAIGISLKIRKTHRSNPSKEIPLKKAA